jgi:hypothetical protein
MQDGDHQLEGLEIIRLGVNAEDTEVSYTKGRCNGMYLELEYASCSSVDPNMEGHRTRPPSEAPTLTRSLVVVPRRS